MPFFLPISELSDRRHSARRGRKKTLYNLLLANCSVLFHSYMSVQAVIVSFIITTCSLAPFRFHHLCSYKQPAAGSRVDFPGATTVRIWVSGYNCCLGTNISFLLSKYIKYPRPFTAAGWKQNVSSLVSARTLPIPKCLLLTSGFIVSSH